MQIQAGLDASPADRGVYETDKWDPCKPFVADKVGVVYHATSCKQCLPDPTVQGYLAAPSVHSLLLAALSSCASYREVLYQQLQLVTAHHFVLSCCTSSC